MTIKVCTFSNGCVVLHVQMYLSKCLPAGDVQSYFNYLSGQEEKSMNELVFIILYGPFLDLLAF